MRLTAYLRSLSYKELLKVQAWVVQELDRRDKDFLSETMTNIKVRNLGR